MNVFLDAIPPLVLEDEREDVLGLVVQAMKTLPENEEAQLHSCGALQLLLETGEVGGVFQARRCCSNWANWAAAPGDLTLRVEAPQWKERNLPFAEPRR